MRDKDNRVIFFMIFLLLGILLAVQFRSTLYLNRQKTSTALSVERLKERISEETKINTDLKTEIDENIAKKESLLKSYLEGKNEYDLLSQWKNIMLKSGFTDVKGPGITIKLDDAVARQDADPMLLIIHDQDIRIILNELKKAGAQAISINGERIVATSELVCAGPTILINRNRYPVPYVINAIGDPDLLYDTLSKSERIAVMIEDKIRIDIKKTKDILVPRFSNVENLEKLISGLEVVDK